jgi:AcrR family transcriptional regulator
MNSVRVEPRAGDLARSTPRGRPRDAAIDERILVAVVAELADVGVSGFSVNSVSARARVGKRSIASRWPDRHALILAGMATLAADLAAPHTGTLRGDLEVLAGRITEMMSEPRRSVLTRCAAELREHPQYYASFQRDSVDRCMAVVQDVLVDARARGEVAIELDVSRAAEFFVGAIMGTHAFTSSRSSASSPVGPLVELITHGLGATVPAAVPPLAKDTHRDDAS